MTAIDLKEFQALFAQEAEVRLSTLGRLVLELERDGTDEKLISSIFREVHTLKGSAAVVGFARISRVAHALEERLEDLRSGRCPVTSELVDALLSAVDGLTVLTAYAVADHDDGPKADAAEASVAAALERFQVSPAITPAENEPLPAVAVPDLEPGAPKVAEAVAGAEGRPGEPQSSDKAPLDSGVVMVPVERLDKLVRLVGESAAAHLRVGGVLATRFEVEPEGIPEFSELSRVLNDLQERTMRTRMVPVATAADQLNRAVRDLSRRLGKLVAWEVRGGDTELDRGVLHQLTDSLLHLVRNAVDHGIETPDEREAAGKPRQATIRLHAMQLGSEVTIAVTDDGGGIDLDRVRSSAARQGVDTAGMSDEDALQLVFRSGLSTSEFLSDISGRGVGLDVVWASVEAIRGRIEVRSERGRGTEFRVVVPITLAVLPCLLITAGGQRFALALHSVILAQAGGTEAPAHADGRPIIWVDDQPVGISNLADLLGLPASEATNGPVVVLTGPSQRHAFQVDRLIGQRDVVVKGLGRLLPRLDLVAGASVDPDGSILVVLDPPGLVERARQTRPAPSAMTADAEHPGQLARRVVSVLVVDDALTIRELQRTILERAGYQVRVACDGMEALALLSDDPSDLVLTDVEMPRMDGFELTEAIRADPSLSNVPVLVLTSKSSDVDRQRGLAAGADGYIVKSAFDERALLAAIERVLECPR
jgi:two-component system chemotaxis sensor kinase CheA